MKYVYACISHKRERDIKDVEKTIKYKKALEIAKALRIENIVIDVCVGRNRKKPNLDDILRTKENIIIVSDITSLGTQEEIADNYKRIVNLGNEILICYYGKGGLLEEDELSTVNLHFEKTKVPLNVAIESLNAMTTTQFRKTSTRVIDPNIIEGYWQVEEGLKTQTEVVKEINTSKSTFMRRAQEYLYSDDWYERYEQEYDRLGLKLLMLPTKIGEISDNGKKMYQYLMDHPDEVIVDENSYPVNAIARYAEIDMELWSEIENAGENNKKENADENNKKDRYKDLLRKYYINAVHYYRESIRYQRYLKFAKYRK